MKIVFLVINYMPHQLVSIQSLLQVEDVEVHSFQYREHPSAPKNVERFHVCSDHTLSKEELLSRIRNIEPEMVVVAGWAVPKFVWVAKKIKKELKIPVVSYSDTQWLGTWRQRINTFISPFHIKKAFTHIWVAGIYQYEYARRLGFKKHEIIFNALSCNVDLFNEVSIQKKRNQYPKNILFIGRFVEIKGLNLLLNAWKDIKNKNGWTLTLVGDGPLKESLSYNDDVFIKDYMPQSKLINEMQHAGCFVLSSKFEQWALVIHEAAAAGLPLVVTEKCGAAPHFVIDGYNGYRVGDDIKSIKQGLERIINADIESLLNFSERSKELSNCVTPELGTAELLSVLD